MLYPGTTVPTHSETPDRLAAALHGCVCEGTQPVANIALSLDTDVLDALHEMGEDWEAHFNTILRSWLRSNSAAA